MRRHCGAADLLLVWTREHAERHAAELLRSSCGDGRGAEPAMTETGVGNQLASSSRPRAIVISCADAPCERDRRSRLISAAAVARSDRYALLWIALCPVTSPAGSGLSHR
jgi:hypothetical protein